MYSIKWRYNGCNRVFACNFHILNNTFTNLISICSLNRAGFSDIGHAHFCCTFHLLNRHICKTYFFELLLGILIHVHETWHVHSSAGADLKLSKSYQKNCGRGLLQEIQLATHSAFCTSGAFPITANTTAQTMACVLTFALSPSSFGANLCGLCGARGPSCAGGLAPIHNCLQFWFYIKITSIF